MHWPHLSTLQQRGSGQSESMSHPPQESSAHRAPARCRCRGASAPVRRNLQLLGVLRRHERVPLMPCGRGGAPGDRDPRLPCRECHADRRPTGSAAGAALALRHGGIAGPDRRLRHLLNPLGSLPARKATGEGWRRFHTGHQRCRPATTHPPRARCEAKAAKVALTARSASWSAWWGARAPAWERCAGSASGLLNSRSHNTYCACNIVTGSVRGCKPFRRSSGLRSSRSPGRRAVRGLRRLAAAPAVITVNWRTVSAASRLGRRPAALLPPAAWYCGKQLLPTYVRYIHGRLSTGLHASSTYSAWHACTE